MTLMLSNTLRSSYPPPPPSYRTVAWISYRRLQTPGHELVVAFHVRHDAVHLFSAEAENTTLRVTHQFLARGRREQLTVLGQSASTVVEEEDRYYVSMCRVDVG